MDLQRIQPGQQLTWLYTPRGGYGYTQPVDAEVVSVGPKKGRIRVKHISGGLVEYSVKPESLRERKAEGGRAYDAGRGAGPGRRDQAASPSSAKRRGCCRRPTVRRLRRKAGRRGSTDSSKQEEQHHDTRGALADEL